MSFLSTDELVVDAIENGNLLLKTACCVAVGLACLPHEVRQQVLAFAMHRRHAFTPYSLAEKYRAIPQTIKLRKTNAFDGLPGFNASIGVKSPYPVANNERIGIRCSGAHSSGIGFCTADALPGSCVRFDPEAVGLYIGIEVLHSHNPEERQAVSHRHFNPDAISLHRDAEHGDYFAWWSSGTLVETARIPARLQGKPLFFIAQTWNHGSVKLTGNNDFVAPPG